MALRASEKFLGLSRNGSLILLEFRGVNVGFWEGRKTGQPGE